MVSEVIDVFKSKYPCWTVSNESVGGSEVLVFNSITEDGDELMSVLLDLKDIFKDKSYSVKIFNSNGYQIRIKKVLSPKKYCRMYTSGCFDIFHYGHLNILKKSKEMCDYLVVGVSTDELILKEKGRLPVIPFSERIKVVEAIQYVDEVIPQVDKNKQRIIDEYSIDAISVGDDWLGRFPQTSCPVEYFSYTENVSSTILKNTLKLG